MKKILVAVLTLSILAGCSSGGSKGKFTDGTFKGVGKGRGGDVNVEVTIKGGKITDITVGENQETGQYLEAAMPVIEEIIKKQDANVDVVSGATLSSQGIIDGVSNALESAK